MSAWLTWAARFRARKKERIANLANEAEELRQRVGSLEKEASKLRTENAYLRGLLTCVHALRRSSR